MTIYRRRYRCPECHLKGKRDNTDRTTQRYVCPSCGTALLLEEQLESGDGYRAFNLPADWIYNI